jgi:DNA repair protein RecO
MVHHIYHTRGIILGSIAVGEANRFYKILTEELGRVGARAQAVRVEKSKLRYALQDFSRITVDLVRGKEVWRIISAAEERAYPEVKTNPARLRLFARVCALTQRLVHGEGREDALFEDIRSALDFLENTPFSTDLEASFEALAAFRSLVFLGYVDPDGYEKFTVPGAWSIETLLEFEKKRFAIIPIINEALHASQL